MNESTLDLSSELTLEQQHEQVRIDLAAMFRLTNHLGWDTVWSHKS